MAKRKSAVGLTALTQTPEVGEYPVKVPAKFMLAGIQWRVVDVPHLQDLGNCERDEATINIRAGLSPQVRASTFFHELQHAILYTTGLQEHSEKEVDLMGALYHQFELTKAYE